MNRQEASMNGTTRRQFLGTVRTAAADIPGGPSVSRAQSREIKLLIENSPVKPDVAVQEAETLIEKERRRPGR